MKAMSIGEGITGIQHLGKVLKAIERLISTIAITGQ